VTIEPIRNDDDVRRAFRHLEKILEAAEDTPQADERDVLVTLIEAWENQHFDFGQADPVGAIRFRMEQEGPTPRDLEPCIGQSGRVSEILNRKRPLCLRMVTRLHDGLEIPCESLMAGVHERVDRCRASHLGRRALSLEQQVSSCRRIRARLAKLTVKSCPKGDASQVLAEFDAPALCRHDACVGGRGRCRRCKAPPRGPMRCKARRQSGPKCAGVCRHLSQREPVYWKLNIPANQVRRCPPIRRPAGPG
jgi:HTH-type transcriptional regulator/antitoxin HigA